jgi:hypothetical protein
MKLHLSILVLCFAASCERNNEHESGPLMSEKEYAAFLAERERDLEDERRRGVVPRETDEDISWKAYLKCHELIAMYTYAIPNDRSRFNLCDGDEFCYSWPSGTIQGGNRDRPDVMTGSMRPSASCTGSYSRREVNWVTINGEDKVTSSSPVGF